eukprot:m51a1_g3961 hypothetical protein (1123) ;mRNA; r:368257-374231
MFPTRTIVFCRAFAVMGILESAYKTATQRTIQLSAQQLVDCVENDSTGLGTGCEGNFYRPALEYLTRHNAMLERSYPYMEQNGFCHATSNGVARVVSYNAVDWTDEAQVMSALVRFGPLGVALSSGLISQYAGGVLSTDDGTCTDETDHAVILVGWTTIDDIPAWVIKNSCTLDITDPAARPFWCTDVEVPVDHFDPGHPDSIHVVFATMPASESAPPPRGTLVYAVGGPGSVSLSYASWTLDTIPPAVRAAFDIVLFDQRGTGLSCGLWCPDAAAAFRSQGQWSDATEAQRQAVLDASELFTDDCIAETGMYDTPECIVGSNLSIGEQLEEVMPFVSTAQAVEDLHAFIAKLEGSVWLYGKSYGTQLMQAYVAKYGSGIAGLVLDCAVDMTLDIGEYWIEELSNADDIARKIGGWCAADRQVLLAAMACFFGVLAALVVAVAGSPPRGSTPCPRDMSGPTDSPFWCTSVAVPVDHFDPRRTDRIRVVFATMPASETGPAPGGTLVYAVGGPGSVSLSYASWTLESIPRDVRASFDIVLFDQRGTGLSCGLWCPVTAAAFRSQGQWSDATEAQRQAVLDASERFSDDCAAETRRSATSECIVGSNLSLGEQLEAVRPFVSTAQAVEDLHAFVAKLRGSVWLYGKSYGTQLMQAYVAKYGSGVAGLVLDCAVDMTLDIASYWAEELGNIDEVCSADLCPESPRNCTGALERVLSALRSGGGVTVDFTLPSGRSARRVLTAMNADLLAVDLLYSTDDRAHLLRAVAAASKGDWLPLLRWHYIESGINQTDGSAPHESVGGFWSEASYFAIQAADYNYDYSSNASSTPRQRAQSFMARLATRRGRLFSGIYISEMPAPFMQSPYINKTLPGPLVAAGIPVLVLTSDTDPAVPTAQSERRLNESVLVVQQGGSHPLWGLGFPCIDTAVEDFLFQRRTSVGKRTCAGPLVGPYIGLAELDSSRYSTSIDVLGGLGREVLSLPELVSFDPKVGVKSVVGCSFGGSVGILPGTAEDTGQSVTLLRFISCQLLSGFVLVGNATLDGGTLTVDTDVSGKWDGDLVFEFAPNSGAKMLKGWLTRHDPYLSFKVGGIVLGFGLLVTGLLLFAVLYYLRKESARVSHEGRGLLS